MLSPEQVQMYRKKYGLDTQSSSSPSTTLPKKKGFVERTKDVITDRAEKAGEIADKTYSKKQNFLSGVLQTAGNAAGALTDIGFEAAKTVLPQKVKDVAKKGIETVASIKPVQSTVEKYNEWAKKHPEASANLGAAFDIGSLLTGSKILESGTGKLVSNAGRIAEETTKVAKKTFDIAKKPVEKAINIASDSVTPIESGVKTVLKDTKIPQGIMSKSLKKYTEQATKALEDYSQSTPMELAGKEAEKALSSLTGKLKSLGEKKQLITSNIGNLDVGDMISNARNQMRELLSDRTGTKFSNKGKVRDALGRTSNISDPSDISLLKNIDDKLASIGKTPTFQKVDDAIDYIQDALYKRSTVGAVPVSSRVETILKNVTKNLNSQLKEIGGKTYTKLNDDYARLKGIQTILNKALGVDANKGASLMKQLFSPNGTMSRKLFAKIKEETGVDLVKEATLAKFAMENIGDVRQASLLEQVLKGSASIRPTGLVKMAAEKILGKIQDPIGKAERIIKQRN